MIHSWFTRTWFTHNTLNLNVLWDVMRSYLCFFGAGRHEPRYLVFLSLCWCYPNAVVGIPWCRMQQWSTSAPSGTEPAEGCRARLGCSFVLQAHQSAYLLFLFLCWCDPNAVVGIPWCRMQQWSTSAPSGTEPAEGCRDRLGCSFVLQAHHLVPVYLRKFGASYRDKSRGQYQNQETLRSASEDSRGSTHLFG